MRSDTHSGRINDVRKSLAGGEGRQGLLPLLLSRLLRCTWCGLQVVRGIKSLRTPGFGLFAGGFEQNMIREDRRRVKQ